VAGIEKFHGTFFHSVDEKGRVAIPHKFRTVLGGANENRVIVARSSNFQFLCLDIYPFAEWGAITDRIARMEITGENAALVREGLRAHFVHHAHELELDKQGRILVPEEHRAFAKIDKEVVYTGDIRKFRLWSKAVWERYQQDMDNIVDKLPPIPEAL